MVEFFDIEIVKAEFVFILVINNTMLFFVPDFFISKGIGKRFGMDKLNRSEAKGYPKAYKGTSRGEVRLELIGTK